jgi:transaldolase
VDEMSVRAAPLLLPAFEAQGGRQGRLSTQTDPTFHRSADLMLAQGLHFDSIAPNIIVKFPATSAGIDAMEAASAAGVSVNTTVCFSVAQAVAAAEAIERGLERRAAAGESTAAMGPVVTIMMGRIEDWLRVQTERDGIIADPAALPWSGVAVFKRAYRIFQERGFRARLLGAAIRHHYHWSELIGGDVVITMPSNWQKRFNASSVEVRPRMDDPVDPRIVDELSQHYPDFVRAHDPDGLSREEFDAFPPTARTLRAFIASYHELLHQVTEAMIPNPDARVAS